MTRNRIYIGEREENRETIILTILEMTLDIYATSLNLGLEETSPI